MISDHYRKMNRMLHKQKAHYGAGGHLYANTVRSLMRIHRTQDVLDYGCGKGTLARELDGPITEYDPAIPGKDAHPSPHDIVVCTDVLEHIEPEYLDAVLDDIQQLAKICVYLVIATRPAKKTLPDGRNAHLIIQPYSWWMEKILERWNPVGSCGLLDEDGKPDRTRGFWLVGMSRRFYGYHETD